METTDETFQESTKQDSFRQYWRVYLVCMKVQAHSFLEAPLKCNQNQTIIRLPTPSPMAVMGGWEIFTGNGGKPGIGWFYNVGDDKVSLHNQQRGANSPILWRLSYIATPTLFQVLSHPLPLLSHLWPPLPLFFLLSCFFG